jgi:hypothetical protein
VNTETQNEYNPNNLLDVIIGKMQLKNDAALSRCLEVQPPVISKIRHHRLPIAASMLIRIHEVTGLSIRDIRELMGDRRKKYRASQDAWSDKRRAEYLAPVAAMGLNVVIDPTMPSDMLKVVCGDNVVATVNVGLNNEPVKETAND